MPSINLRRSAATLGVVAGLLAAAAPASAQIGPAPETANGFGLSFEHIDSVKAPTNAGTQIGIED